MRNEKKIAFQSRRIAELEKQVKSLEAENKSMERDIERYKKIISLNNTTIDKLNEQVIAMKNRYVSAISEATELNAHLKSIIDSARYTRNEYEQEIAALINRVKHRK